MKGKIEQAIQQVKIEPSRPLFINPAREANREPNQSPEKQENDPARSQDRIKSLVVLQKAKETIAEVTSKKAVSISQRFTQVLGYARTTENTDKNLQKDTDVDRG